MGLDADLIKALATAATVVVAVISSIAAALWAVLQYLNDRRDARQESARLEGLRLEQLKRDAESARAAHVSELISRFSAASTADDRIWTTLAMSLYPREASRLLVLSLGQIGDDTEAGLRLALLSIGADALPDLVRMNKLAQASASTQDSLEKSSDTVGYDVEQALHRSRQVIAAILAFTSKDDLSDLDLEGADLQGCSLRGSQLYGVRFRKVNLAKAYLGHSMLNKSAFRGASLDKTIVSGARMLGADFTGSDGALVAVQSIFDGTEFKRCDLKGSDFSGASMCRIRSDHDSFAEACFAGVRLDEAIFSKTRMMALNGRRLRGSKTVFLDCRLPKAVLEEATLPSVKFTNCEMVGLVAQGITATNARFFECDLRGANFTGADLTGAVFERCQFGGADFTKAKLSGAKIEGTRLDAATFDESVRKTFGASASSAA